MDTALSVGAAFLGFFATLFVWSKVVRWAHAIWTARKTPNNSSGRSVAVPVLLVAHSAPWLLAAYVVFCYHIFGNPHRQEWSWFWAGAAAVPPVILLLVLSVLRRIKRTKALVAKSIMPDSS